MCVVIGQARPGSSISEDEVNGRSVRSEVAETSMFVN
jgi:hypothetical protein